MKQRITQDKISLNTKSRKIHIKDLERLGKALRKILDWSWVFNPVGKGFLGVTNRSRTQRLVSEEEIVGCQRPV